MASRELRYRHRAQLSFSLSSIPSTVKKTGCAYHLLARSTYLAANVLWITRAIAIALLAQTSISIFVLLVFTRCQQIQFFGKTVLVHVEICYENKFNQNVEHGDLKKFWEIYVWHLNSILFMKRIRNNIIFTRTSTQHSLTEI